MYDDNNENVEQVANCNKSVSLADENILLKNDIEFFKNKSKENFDLFLRAKAETENIKKRTDREIDNIVKYANKKIFLDLLPILDSLEACLNNKNEDHYKEGMNLFYKMFNNILEQYSVKKINIGDDIDFDPTKHEVINIVDSNDYDGKISEVKQQGYTLNDQVLRYSKVTIFKKKKVDNE